MLVVSCSFNLFGENDEGPMKGLRVCYRFFKMGSYTALCGCGLGFRVEGLGFRV